MVSGRLPGTVIGQVFRPGTSTPRDFPRYTGIIAKGLDIKLFRDASVVRSAVVGEILPFSGTTYLAPLAHPAIPDQTRARLYTADGRTVSTQRWRFLESSPGSNVFDTVSIDPTYFSSGATYNFDYIANDPALSDEVPVDDLREVTAVGDNQGQVQYHEGIDFNFTTTATGPTPGVNNLHPTDSSVTAVVAATSNTGTGTVAHNSSTYTHSYNRTYVATCTAAAGAGPNRTATLRFEVFPTSSGHDTAVGRSAVQLNQIDVNLVENTPSTLTNVPIEFGITLDFTFGGSNFVIGDIFTFNGDGPGLLELSDPNLNTNQFAETSAVVADNGNAGEGTVAVNPQSVYTGTANQTYEIQCTASAGTGASRSASFRWRTNPKLKCLTGTVTATNGSATVTGVNTVFTTEVAAGDKIFFGASPRPVTVLSVTNATTLVLTATFPLPTQTATKALRYRESTGTITSVLVTAPNRLVLDQGLLLDFDFGSIGTDNFTVGDKFSFTAKVASNHYNGKENRNYAFGVTSTSTPHQLIATYAGSTPLSLFGSQTFQEGTPLVLPNNVVVYARNMTLATRFDAIAPADTFELSLTFDGLIDWTLEAEATETISTSDILRDLTGNITGTVGAYYVLLNKVPDSVLYVSGPSPSFTNIAFNTVAGTTIVYFLSNPAVNLTIKYRFAGNEPEPGATYFLSGFQKRPDSDYEQGQLFTTRDAARAFLAPMTPTNDAAIANEIAWNQNSLTLPGVVIFLVKDSDGDGTFTNQDYRNAIEISKDFKGTTDIVTVNQFQARADFRDSIVVSNDPTVARRRIGYFGYPTNYPIGDEFTTGSRIFTARRELQVFAETVAKGTLAIIGNSFAKMTINVDSIGGDDLGTVPTQVTLDGSFLAVALAARTSSFDEPWQTVYNLPVSGFDEIEVLSESQMIQLQDAGIITLRVDGDSAFYVGTMTTDNTEPSTQQLSGTVQRQYVLSRLESVINERVIGFVADSPEEAAERLAGEIVSELGSMVSEGKIARFIDPTTGIARALDPTQDVLAIRDPRDPTRSFFRAHWYQKYPTLFVDGIVAVDSPLP